MKFKWKRMDNKNIRLRGERTYDVRISINEHGNGTKAVRIGFLNESAKIFKDFDYIAVSSITKDDTAIGFKLFKLSDDIDIPVTKLSRNRNLKSRFTTFTPSTEELGVYLRYWDKGQFAIQYDLESGCYYIKRD